jgi:hypothetical protein
MQAPNALYESELNELIDILVTNNIIKLDEIELIRDVFRGSSRPLVLLCLDIINRL